MEKYLPPEPIREMMDVKVLARISAVPNDDQEGRRSTTGVASHFPVNSRSMCK